MEIPKFNETFLPILDILKNGDILSHRELLNQVIEKHYSNLPQELLEEKTKSGDILINNRIAWGKSYLKKGGYVHYPKRGFVQITDKGMHASTQQTPLEEVESDFINFYKEESVKDSEKKEFTGLSPQDLIESGFATIESQLKNEILEKLKEIDPYYFEKVILILLKKMGYGDFIETSKSGDKGIDGIINKDTLGLEKIYIQAKRFNENKVREKDIRNFIGAMSGDTQNGVFVTTSSFDISAVKKAQEAHHSIILIDGSKLASLMVEYNVGVQIVNTYEVKEIDEDFYEEV